MIKTVVKALEGFEELFDKVNLMKANLEEEKQAAINKAIAEVEVQFVEKAQRIEKALESVSTTEEVEVPDEVEAVVSALDVEPEVINEPEKMF